ncbi:MAG TPA: GGDEF domain-containing protein [Gemmatimonadaceae bacterium]|jgi:diguanylate cyclase (GGDEF)-like protein|nr:GGDEF domain-containing protein [Gemmatimonadaceae bacterium]
MSINPTQELSVALGGAELGVALRSDRDTLRREVLLWQRWVRYLALGTMVLLTLVFSPSPASAFIPLSAIAIGYVAIVLGTTWMLLHGPSLRAQAAFPTVLIAADIIALAGVCYLTSAPDQMHRILLLGFLSMQIGVFYFGWQHGAFAATLTVVAYLICTLGPPFVPGHEPGLVAVTFNVTLFAIISMVLIHTFGSFRERMEALRVYCKVVERGEAARLPRLGTDRWPDEFTLLARAFLAMHERLAEQIGSDPLTGCMNRRTLATRLRSDLRHARRRLTSVAVVAIDLDNFKEINDSRGHPVGDVVLQQIVSVMQSTARDTDTVARSGGDEFVIVLPDTDWEGAVAFAERLRSRVEEQSFGPPGSAMQVTISIGVALARGGDQISTDMLLEEADSALYKAKTGGRNRVSS